MTQNQIRYAEHLETSRHNKVSERHEHFDVYNNKRKTAEANLRTAAAHEKSNVINWFSAQEQKRANLAKEEETSRANRAKELETNRSNLAKEQLSAVANEISRQHYVNQDEATFRRVDTEWNQLENQRNQTSESIRHNKALEELTSLAQSETHRANLANESIARSNVGLGYANLAEASRTHRVNEDINTRSQRATQRLQEAQGKATISQALSASKQASAAVTRASAAVSQAGASIRQAEAAESQARSSARKATSDRITAISQAIDTGTKVASELRKLLM